MSNPPQSPDRRPLVYTAMGLLIVAIAAVLFWPRPAERGPDALVLTPNDVPESTETASDPLDDALPETPLQAAEETVEAVDPPAENFPVEDAQLNESTVVDAKPATPAPRRAEPPAPARTEAKAPSGPAPGDNGPYLLNVGSFGDRANAASLVQKLGDQGVPARISTAQGQHGTVYRVQIGYFEGHSVAEAYGREVKRRAGVDFWVARR